MRQEQRGDIWFVYGCRAGEIRARQINGRGRIALLGCSFVTAGSGAAVFLALVRGSAMLAALVTVAIIVAGVLGALRLAVAKGRRVDWPPERRDDE